MKLRLAALALCLAAAPAAAQVWVDGRGRSCDAACGASGLAPVVSGVYVNGQPFYMCSADPAGEGVRGGYNLRPDWANSCTVGYGGRETSVASYSCLCAMNAPPQRPVVRIRVDEATYGANCGLPRGNATAQVASLCNGETECDLSIDETAFGGSPDCREFTVRYSCGADTPKTSRVTFSGSRVPVLLTCP